MKSRIAKPAVVISSSQAVLRVPRKKIERLIAFVARAEGARIAEVDVAVVSSRQIARLNRRWLGCRGATDVISFDLSGPRDAGEPISAQIVVCADVAVSHARRHNLPPQRELLLYVLHGLLHLIGYDDANTTAAAKMHARQEEILQAFMDQDRRRRR